MEREKERKSEKLRGAKPARMGDVTMYFGLPSGYTCFSFRWQEGALVLSGTVERFIRPLSCDLNPQHALFRYLPEVSGQWRVL